ncbi:MAG: tRNA pseudouridine(38-40) synthase TruA [Nitrospinota bacterium]|nr:MAG: tRNA pseudouridine(38-40) synthase TruA [Nitrospinota bacterium]
MRNIKMTLEYDGTAYHGWQIQQEQPTIQQVVEEALSTILNTPTRVFASGRTDAGVHALAQVAHFRTESPIPLPSLLRGVNSLLPPDIAVKEMVEVPDDFHARYSARGKIYKYQILTGPLPSAFLHRYAWHIPRPLDLSAMEKAARLLEGTHDFTSFRGRKCMAPSPVRTISRIWFSSSPPLLTIFFQANAFLKHMVRNLVGTLVEVGLGKRAPTDIPRILAGRDRRLAGRTAPPQGLFLVKVLYDGDTGSDTETATPHLFV